MANPDAAFGLKPVRYLSGAPYNGAANLYYIPSTDTVAVYIGSVVKPAGSADSAGIMSVTGDITTGDAVLGAVVGVKAVTQESTTYRALSTERYVWVADDPNLVYEVQDDAASTMTAANVGNSADLTSFTSGSTITGLSSTELSVASLTDTGDGTQDVLVTGLSSTPDNSIGDNAVWLVRLNNHFFVDGQGGA